LGIYGRIKFRWLRALSLSGTGCSGHGNELSDSIKDDEFFY
jgi:hypothetical protein